MKTLRVKAAAGRKVPIHASVARAIGGAQLFVEGDAEHELPDVSFVRRRIAVGDLVVVGRTHTTSVKAGPHTAAPSAPVKKES